MTLVELGQRVDSQEFARWRAYDRLYPIDHALRIEIGIARIVAAYTGTSVSDHVPDWGKRWQQAADLDRHVDDTGAVVGVDPDKLDAVFSKMAGT